MSGRHLAFPFRIDSDGRTAAPQSLDEHVKGEIIQLLLTSPGERPFLPGFGGGLKRLAFERNDGVTAGLAKAMISQSLSRYLGHRIAVEALMVTTENSTLAVHLRYRVIATGETRQLHFERQEGA